VESDLDAFVGDLQARVIKDATEVYSEEVIRRWLDTPHAGVMKDPDAHARVTGPCGDTMEVFLAIREGRVVGASFVTDGCASTIACGSMTCDLAIGKPVTELRAGRVGAPDSTSGALMRREVTPEAIVEALGGLPEADLHCALLAARTLDEAAAGWAGRSEGQGGHA